MFFIIDLASLKAFIADNKRKQNIKRDRGYSSNPFIHPGFDQKPQTWGASERKTVDKKPHKVASTHISPLSERNWGNR